MSPQSENLHNLIYAFIQILHNFGAVATLGGYLTALVVKGSETRNKAAWIILMGWGVQGGSGGAFGMTSFFFYHKVPEIGEIGMAMLMTKIVCVTIGFTLVGAYLIWGSNWNNRTKDATWLLSSIFAVVALTAAAFLRWFS